MVIFSVGMVKAGSAWLWNMTNDMLVAAGFADARQVREKYRLQRVTSEVNCNIGDPSTKRMLFAMYPSLFFGQTYTLKSHSGPTPIVEQLMKLNLIKVSYLRRDLRDVILSALDHGERSRRKGIQNPFVQYDSLDVAIPLALRQADRWKAWQAIPNVFHTSYEELLEDTLGTMLRLRDFLAVDVSNGQLTSIVERYEGGRIKKSALHYHKGVAGRFRQSFSEQEIRRMESEIGDTLEMMGYERVLP